MQQPSPAAPSAALTHADSATLVAMLKDLEGKVEQMSAPRDLICDVDSLRLCTRLEALHGAKLLSDDEFGRLEDCVADGIEATADCDALTREAVQSSPAMGRLHKLIVLSEKMPQDAMFARQARRKFGPA